MADLALQKALGVVVVALPRSGFKQPMRLPLLLTAQMDPFLKAGAVARRDELFRIVTFKAEAAPRRVGSRVALCHPLSREGGLEEKVKSSQRKKEQTVNTKGYEKRSSPARLP
jgi:hypothetical protein